MTLYGYDIETTGVRPYSSEIVTIQYKRDSTGLSIYKRWEYESERELLLAFLNDWKDIPRARSRGAEEFIAFNVLKFDAPFLLVKAQQHDIASASGWEDKYVWENISHGPPFVDLAQLLGDDMKKFAEWRNCLIGSYGDYESKRIPEFYQRDDYEKIEEYVEDEMDTLEQIYQEIQNEPFYKELQDLRETAELDWKNRDNSTLSDF
ncbi:hypothetical protein NDI76_05750 [Halogeometricum sp. S1BR25-6]|uniref:Uncharacterized protein n=1 Tax=Halogeometricum salsisoli TaxID=2950536 RepID=A0ABU2GDI5_9EURY|nr:hypothetical protein [Halogeometricum sp. S1BR25-6]MDS0298239.1 hypothetical protein [Halogeometricum sp. S1BR25-6]